MQEDKYKTCRHSTGRVGELIVYVHPSCPALLIINGTLCSSKLQCDNCKCYEPRKEEKNGD